MYVSSWSGASVGALQSVYVNERPLAFLPCFEEAVMSPAKVVRYGNQIADVHAGSDHFSG
jgi:hypothetical protein